MATVARTLPPTQTPDGEGPSPSWQEVLKVAASDEAGGDNFGHAVSLDGDTAAVGSPRDDEACPEDPACDSGSVYVVGRDEGGEEQWGEVEKLTVSDAIPGDQFGLSVAIDGDTILVGSRANLTGPFNSGAVQVFERNQGGPDSWGEVTQIRASDESGRELFGVSVSLDGDTAIVGAYWDDDACPANIQCNSGSAYLFERNEGGMNAWGEIEKLTASDATLGDEFGSAVAISGDTVVVSTIRGGSAGSNSGAVYVFERNEAFEKIQGGMESWSEVKKLTASDAVLGDQFGSSVAISGDTLVVGAVGNDDDGDSSGSAYVFGRNEGGMGQWGEVTKLTASDAAAEDLFGTAVSVSGDTLIVGAWGNDDAGQRSGAAYVFHRDEGSTGSWGEVEKLTASDAAFDDRFGSSVALDGGTAVVGADHDSNVGLESGSIYVFEDLSGLLFADGFESGNTSAWSRVVP